MAKLLFIFLFFSFYLVRKSADTQEEMTQKRCMGLYK